MIIHLGIADLYRRLKYFFPIPFVIAATAFVTNLCHYVHPGTSANLIASALGLTTPSGVAHPLFSLITRSIASQGTTDSPLHLNMFCMLCGIFCAMLIYHLVARTILLAACENADEYLVDPVQDDESIYPEE